jgi:hypothetical protein
VQSMQLVVRGGVRGRCGPLPVADVHERVGLDYMDAKALLCGDRPGSDDAALRIQVCTACILWAQRVRRSEDNGAAAFVAEQQGWPHRRYHTLLRRNTIGASFPDGLTAPLDDELPTESV